MHEPRRAAAAYRAAALGLFFLVLLARAGAAALFSDGERVLFLGDSITRAGGWHSLAGLFYETRFPDRHITWLNAGISGDTAAGALRRLQWDVLDRKPDQVVLMFGMNDIGMLQCYDAVTPEKLAQRQARLADYTANLDKLITLLKNAGIKVTLCTPSPYDEAVKLDKPAYAGANAALTRCAGICRELAAMHDLPLVDFNGPMNSLASDFQKTNPGFTLIGADRIHPGALGNTVMACLFLMAQGAPGTVSETVISADTGKVEAITNAVVSELVATRGDVRFTLMEKALPFPLEGEARKALHLVPLERDLNRQRLTVTGLDAGEYELLVDDQPVGRWWHDALAGGINVAGLRSTPQSRQAAQVAAVHDKRHGDASGGPRSMAFVRHFTLAAAGVDANDPVAVEAVLKKLIDDPAAKDNPDLAFSGFAQTMAKKYLEGKPKEAETTAAIAAAEAEIYQKNQPVSHRYWLRRVASPVPADRRQAAFAARRQPAQVEALAKSFLELLILDPAGMQRGNLRLRPLLQKVADTAKSGNATAAIEAYRDYCFDKLRNPAAYGLPRALLDPYGDLIKVAEREKVLAQADLLMTDKFSADAAPMPPGTVWLPPGKEGYNGTRNPWTPAAFQPLAVAYLLTGERRYLDKWVDYMDDWAMNEMAGDAIRPTDISDDDSHAVAQVLTVYRILGGFARMQPSGRNDFPADSLARILGRLIRLYPPLSIVYHDSNPQNWTPGATASLMQVAALMDEFRAAEYIFNRARQRHENYGTIQFLPDGSETEHALWYNCHYFDGAWEALELADARRELPPYQRPAWEEPLCRADWKEEQCRKISERNRFFLQMLTPQSQYPIGNRSDQRTLPDWKSSAMVDYAVLNGATDLRVLLNTLRGNTAAGLPDFTLSAFPYCGSFILRTGWGKSDSYAHFFCSPYPVGGHALQGLKSNNGFWLSSAGQDLLVAGGFGSYSYDRSPLRVDGREQFSNVGIGNPGINKNHKGFGVAYVDPLPPEWRSHSSRSFDLVEGLYDRPYGDFVDDHHDLKDYRVDFLAERARGVITGVSHQRQVFFVKDPGLWIVVDRLRSREPHRYTLDWRLPLASIASAEGARHNRYGGKTFEAGEIAVDEGLQAWITSATNMPNLGIHHFGPHLTFEKAREDGESIKNDYTSHYKMYDFQRVSGSWQSAGDDLVISLIEVCPVGGASGLKSTEALGDGRKTRGFKALMTSGRTLSFLAVLDGVAGLEVDGVRALAGELLVSGGAGIALDCDRMAVAGNALPLPCRDVEFTAPAMLVPIYRPIQPVGILPARTVIARDESITLTCATPGVDLRYTLDGSEPTPRSKLYTEPFVVGNSVTVKARAFRPGCMQSPATLAGTHASVTAVAYYTCQVPLAPVAAVGDPRYSAGLKGEYREGDWKSLVFFPDSVVPLKTQTVKTLFERCSPRVDKVFGWNYTGYLAIPGDGIYTLHAPREMVTSPQEPGYALRCFVGQELLPNGRTSGALNEWCPATTRHGYGTWSIALKKGLHPLRVIYTDYRTDAVERLNHPGLRLNTIWDGGTPELLISGPGIEKQPIPAGWYFRPAK